MKKTTILLCLTIQFINAQSYKKIHANAIVVDAHNDILMKAVDNGLVFDIDLKE